MRELDEEKGKKDPDWKERKVLLLQMIRPGI
jgi:hypothetical protein